MINETADIETSSSQYAQRFRGEVGQWFLERQLSFTKKLLNYPASSTILDIGGGHAQLANPLSQEGYNVTVIGSDDSCSSLLSPQVSFVKGNLIQLPFENKTFDTVLCFRFISHCESWKQLISEASRVAKNQVIIEYPIFCSINALAPLLFSIKKNIEKDTRTFTLFSQREIVNEFKKHSFIHDASLGQYVAPMALHRAVKNRKFSESLENILHALTFGFFASPNISSFKKS